MDNYFFFSTIVVFLAIAIISAYVSRQKQKKRAASLQEIAEKLGFAYTEKDSGLADQIKDLMDGKRSAQAHNTLHFEENGHECLIVDYSHMVKSGKSSRRVYRTAVAIPIKHDNIPLFYIQPSRLTDGISHWFNWPEVEIFGNEEFNRQFGLKTKPDYVGEVEQYFDAHQPLVDFCQDYAKYRLATDGRWLVWYNPKHHIKPDIDAVTQQIEHAKNLIKALELSGGKPAAWGSYSDTAEDHWSSSYDDDLKKLKDDQ